MTNFCSDSEEEISSWKKKDMEKKKEIERKIKEAEERFVLGSEMFEPINHFTKNSYDLCAGIFKQLLNICAHMNAL